MRYLVPVLLASFVVAPAAARGESVVASAASAGGAQAVVAQASPQLDRWQAGLAAAYITWGGRPPCGTPTFDHHESGVDPLDGRAFDMQVVMDLAHPELADCVIHVSERAEGIGPGDACAEVVHEVGHLWGRGHSSTPGDVMAAGGVRYAASWACRRMLVARTYAHRCVRRLYHVTDCTAIRSWRLRPGVFLAK